MSILLDEAQEAIGIGARRVLDARLDKACLLGLIEASGEYDAAFWSTAVEQGWPALAIAEEHGGLALGLIELGQIAQACGAATVGAPFLTTNYGSALALMAGQDEQLQRQWLPRLAAGKGIAAVAFAEGNSPFPDRPSVTLADGLLYGAKTGVVAGLVADFAVVWASDGGRPVLVLAELGGARREVIRSFDNSRLYADIDFAGVPAMLLREGEEARAVALDVMARMAVATAFEQTGGAEAAMLTARDYANTRKAFGQPIGAFQSVKHRIAELYVLVEIARANCIHAASREGQADFLAAAAAARLSASEAYDTAARDAVQIHGGIGVTWESGLHLHMRRARSLAIEQGNTLFWEDLLVGELARADA